MKRFWFTPPVLPEGPHITVYRCCFTLKEAQTVSFEFSADERAMFFLDGQRIMEGPERGAPQRWYKQNCSFTADAGNHTLTVRVLALGFHKWSYGQLSVRTGLWIDEKQGILQNWEYQIESGCSFEAGFPDWGAFPRVHLDTTHNNGILLGRNGSWQPVALFEDERELFAPDLPLMRYEKVVPEKLSSELYYFAEYVCVWAQYRFSGKGKVSIRWAETPYLTGEFDLSRLTGKKGKRNGTYFVGNFDTFEIDGELFWHDYWWHAGHYCQIIIEGEVDCQPEFFRTGYPYGEFKAKNTLEKMAFETLQACSFETYMDCPYYEQLMYIGDSRLEAICTRLITGDDRLIRKALRMLSLSQRPDGSLNSQYPSRSVQTIPSFMLIWILMLHDHWQVNGADELVKELLPRVEKLLGFFRNCEKDGLLSIDGWNFIDWCKDPLWNNGTPPGGTVNSILNLFYVLTLRAVSDMTGDEKFREKSDGIAGKIRQCFFDEEKGLYAIDPEHKYYSEHSQVLGLLIEDDPALREKLREYQGKLTPCSIYFSFYYLQVCHKYGMDDLAEKRLQCWRDLMDEGLTTFPEEFVNPRSDCHAWSSHILCYLLKPSHDGLMSRRQTCRSDETASSVVVGRE
ncbi:MAG: hypothetical protein IJW33_05980 [Lentisphaeria bacterium]|nr:hypothetical protein [Lentisphaeria bacterium]